jgi:hypothetical protein
MQQGTGMHRKWIIILVQVSQVGLSMAIGTMLTSMDALWENSVVLLILLPILAALGFVGYAVATIKES